MKKLAEGVFEGRSLLREETRPFLLVPPDLTDEEVRVALQLFHGLDPLFEADNNLDYKYDVVLEEIDGQRYFRCTADASIERLLVRRILFSDAREFVSKRREGMGGLKRR